MATDTTRLAVPVIPFEDTEPMHEGCSCGRRKPKAAQGPLLYDSLVIAARDRAREPELPAATEQHVLATPVSSRLAAYDVVVLGAGLEARERESRVASEFARHDHRVFHIGNHPSPDHRPTAPLLYRLPYPPGAVQDFLALARERDGIEAAIVVSFAPLDPDLVQTMRDRWNWRIAAPSTLDADSQALADLIIDFDVDDSAAPEAGRVALPPRMAWPSRWAVLNRRFRETWPRASVIVLTHDNLAFSRMCVASILENTEYPNYELIVVDNASQDGTRQEMERIAQSVRHVRVLANGHNAGFGPGNNQALAAATGDLLFLLNNDTMTPRGWLTRLSRHLADDKLGLIGPGTNRTCNEAQIDLRYQTWAEYQAAARRLSVLHEGERYPIRMPMMFCTGFRRDVYERIGPLDERYEVGMFEDEDYALRAKAAGYDVAWTPEVYVHHAYHASIGKLLPTGDYMRLVEQNKSRFEEKWGITWVRHRPLPPRSA
ncbi:MAG: glycosyltransferase [Thermomicrobiales bacterium]|nr:glycosyltransferase [Thermomicrobiales bacterium]